MKTLLELERGECRWPFGEGPFLFCGEATQEHSSYCSEHHAIAWVKPIAKPAKARIYHGTDMAA